MILSSPQNNEGPRLSDLSKISSDNNILQNMVQTCLLFMPINQISMLLISMPKSAITVSQIHLLQ